jgi:serine/threonine-protein kinase
MPGTTACPKLEESFAQDPATGTLLAVALCQEMSGKTASAWANFGEVAVRSRRDGRADREQAAREHQAALEPKLSRLAIDVDASIAALPGLQVTRDGTNVGAAAWGASLPCDPGQHTISVSAKGKETWTTTVMLAAVSDVQTVSVPVLRDAVSVASSPAQGQAQAPLPSDPNSALESTPPSDHAASRFPLRTVGIVAMGAGLVGLGVGSYFGLHAKSLYDQSKQNNHCDSANSCDATGGEKREEAKRSATWSTVSFVAGGMLAAAGVTLFVLDRRAEKSARAPRLKAVPAVGRNEAGVLLLGRF